MTAVAPSTAVVVNKRFYTTGQDGDQMCCLAREVMVIIEQKVAEYNREYNLNQQRLNEEEGGIELIAHKWAAQSGRTPEAALRRLYAYRNESVTMTLHNADELLLSVGEFIEDHEFTEFPGGIAAAKEQAQLYSPDRSAEGKRKYAEAVWQRTKDILLAEYEAFGRPKIQVRR